MIKQRIRLPKSFPLLFRNEIIHDAKKKYDHVDEREVLSTSSKYRLDYKCDENKLNYNNNKHTENPSDSSNIEMNDGNDNPSTSMPQNMLPSDFCMTSLTSSGIGSMKSSTISVTTGSPMHIHLPSGQVDTAPRQNQPKAALVGVSEHYIHDPKDDNCYANIELTLTKRMPIANNGDETCNLTDIEDVDTSGIFSLSETSPLKKHKHPSQSPLEKDSESRRNVCDENTIAIKADVTSEFNDIIEVECVENAPKPTKGNLKEKQPIQNNKSSVRALTSVENKNLQRSNSSMGVKRERLDSENEVRRKGIPYILVYI